MRRILFTALVGLAVAAPAVPAFAAGPTTHDVCGPAAPGHVRCLAEIRTDGAAHRSVAGTPAGYGPADLRAAYALPAGTTVRAGRDAGPATAAGHAGPAHAGAAGAGSGETVAIVDAGGDAAAAADLAVYRSTYGLPACTADDGCFRQVNQRGDAAPLPDDAGWGVEISLDLDAVSAVCPSCRLLLVEADSSGMADMAAAVDTAVRLGATVVSNSYGGRQDGGSARYAASYRHPGVAIVASSGDDGYGQPNTPSAYDSVVAVGGTTLTRADTARGWRETAWSGAGSGCSAWTDKPSWQHDANCPGRMVADVSAVADPATGLAVYDGNDGLGWGVVGGTSASAPIVAGVIALAGHPGLFPDASHLYATGGLTDVVGGGNASDAADCGGDYQCTGVPGYDGPTGNGTPYGLAAF
ncbi:MAG TPA: S8 family serine peptidase [Actinocatenispora sp.]